MALACCVLCGRDTRSRDQVCRQCRGAKMPSLYRDLPSLRIAGADEEECPDLDDLDFALEPNEHRASYHGGTLRDDL